MILIVCLIFSAHSAERRLTEAPQRKQAVVSPAHTDSLSLDLEKLQNKLASFVSQSRPLLQQTTENELQKEKSFQTTTYSYQDMKEYIPENTDRNLYASFQNCDRLRIATKEQKITEFSPWETDENNYFLNDIERIMLIPTSPPKTKRISKLLSPFSKDSPKKTISSQIEA